MKLRPYKGLVVYPLHGSCAGTDGRGGAPGGSPGGVIARGLPPGEGGLFADDGRLFGRLYDGAGPAGGAAFLGDPPPGRGGLAPVVPAFTAPSSCCCSPLKEPPKVPVGVPVWLTAGERAPDGGNPGILGPGPVGGVCPNCPVPENCEVGVRCPSKPLSSGSRVPGGPMANDCEKSLAPGLLFGGGGGTTGSPPTPGGCNGGKFWLTDGTPGKSMRGLAVGAVDLSFW